MNFLITQPQKTGIKDDILSPGKVGVEPCP
jgi:hypothetical protein